MLRYACDIETNGLLHELDRVHSLVLRDLDTNEVISCSNEGNYLPVQFGLSLLEQADLIVGHNFLNFDMRGIAKVYPTFKIKENCDIHDTLIISRVLSPEMETVDAQKYTHIDSKYKGRHSLAAWGERLGVEKIKFTETQTKKTGPKESVWERWSEEMQVYCEQDTLVTKVLYEYFQTQELDPRCFQLEHEFAAIMTMQEDFGFPFNERAAFALVNTLKARRSEIHDQLQEVFPPIVEERVSEKTGKKLKDRVVLFNPGSRQQTAQRLRERYPEISFSQTEKGNVKVDDEVLEKLGAKYPEAKLLAEYQTLNKRLGQIAEGKEAWLTHSRVFDDSRIHGTVITNACISGRCSHRRPNMAQIPSVGHQYGAECRALFVAPMGWLLCGSDASGLELRALGAWLAHFDGGEYAKLVSTDGFDIHTHNAKLFGIFDGQGDISKATRDLSKRLIYALLYGAGSKKVGSVIDPTLNEWKQADLGKETINTFYKNLPAIKQLKDKIDERISERGYLTGIDGRHLQIRSRHSALNQLLQSTGAITVKKATTILYDDLKELGLRWGQDYAFVAHVHDEIQSLVRPQFVEAYKTLAIASFRKSGEYFNLKCPMTGEARVGHNWMETH
ncbi:MAG: DNA polymerase [Bacteroidetes bacterium]|nr:MAG: DNA polymerase [Bacteroidota bacterium]REK63952.1 MAG: DNA polymerase [Bacteroidota bacterium]